MSSAKCKMCQGRGLTVFCFCPIVDVGLNATRIVMISPGRGNASTQAYNPGQNILGCNASMPVRQAMGMQAYLQ